MTLQQMDFGLYLLLDVDVPWVNDGTRTFPEGRKEHFERLKSELYNRGIKPVIITGKSFEDRTKQAIEAVNSWYTLPSNSF